MGKQQAQQQVDNTLSQFTPMSVKYQQNQIKSTLALNPPAAAQSPAVASAAADDIAPNISSDTSDYLGAQPMNNLLNPQNNVAFWT